jgi:putative transcriptional regulator
MGKDSEQSLADGTGSLIGQMLIAMPAMSDPRFQKSLIYVCAHSEKGAMGLVVNKPLHHITFEELLDQLDIGKTAIPRRLPVHFGGPVETGRGFVLHSLDYCLQEATLRISEAVGLTATVDVLRAIAGGKGPWQALLALGYAGWAPGQLEGEIRANGWLHCPADEELLFGGEFERKWQRAMSKLGIDVSMLSSAAGNA